MNGLKIIIAILVLAATVHTPIAQAEKVPVQLAQLEPEDYPDYVNSGVRKYNYGDYKGAISDYDQAYRLSPLKSYSIQQSRCGSCSFRQQSRVQLQITPTR